MFKSVPWFARVLHPLRIIKQSGNSAFGINNRMVRTLARQCARTSQCIGVCICDLPHHEQQLPGEPQEPGAPQHPLGTWSAGLRPEPGALCADINLTRFWLPHFVQLSISAFPNTMNSFTSLHSLQRYSNMGIAPPWYFGGILH